MNDDGFNRIVIGKLLELRDDLLGRENYAIEVDDRDLRAEAGKCSSSSWPPKLRYTSVNTASHEQRKQPAAHEKPYPNPRTPFSHIQTSVALEIRGESADKRSDCRVSTYSRSEFWRSSRTGFFQLLQVTSSRNYGVRTSAI